MQPDSISPGAVKTEEEHRRDICTAGRWLRERGFVVATDGNISVRLDSRRILTSPTGMSKGTMIDEDMVIVDLEGHRLSGRRNPSSELAMHLLIYRCGRISMPFATRILRLPPVTRRRAFR